MCECYGRRTRTGECERAEARSGGELARWLAIAPTLAKVAPAASEVAPRLGTSNLLAVSAATYGAVACSVQAYHPPTSPARLRGWQGAVSRWAIDCTHWLQPGVPDLWAAKLLSLLDDADRQR
eukprot:5237147-Prymnesium_polylepis.1